MELSVFPTTSRKRAWATALPIALAMAALASPAQAAVPYKEIVSADGPLTSVAIGDELSCQVSYRGDQAFELFPASQKPGDCGTFVVTGNTLYAPNFSAHGYTFTDNIGPSTPYTPISQSSVSGSGTTASPYTITTVADAGTSGLRITQVDSYISGQESYRTETTVQNVGAAPAQGILYRAGDCYLQENDTGYGFLDAANGAVGCSVNANNAPAGRIEQWYPLTPGSQYMEGYFADVWTQIGTHAPLPNTTRATESVDNGAAISWNFSVAPGAQATYAHYTTFSPTGNAGVPPTVGSPPTAGPTPTPTAAPTPSRAFGPSGLLSTPTNAACISKRYFPIRVRKRFWPNIAAVTIKMPRTTRVLKRRPWGTNVDLRGLPKGTFKVRITALTTTGKAIRGTRTYRTCSGRLRGGVPPL